MKDDYEPLIGAGSGGVGHGHGDGIKSDDIGPKDDGFYCSEYTGA